MKGGGTKEIRGISPPCSNHARYGLAWGWLWDRQWRDLIGPRAPVIPKERKNDVGISGLTLRMQPDGRRSRGTKISRQMDGTVIYTHLRPERLAPDVSHRSSTRPPDLLLSVILPHSAPDSTPIPSFFGAVNVCLKFLFPTDPDPPPQAARLLYLRCRNAASPVQQSSFSQPSSLPCCSPNTIASPDPELPSCSWISRYQ